MRTTSDAALETRRAIVRYVSTHPGCTVQQVQEALGITRTALNHYRTHLTGIGVLEIKRDGKPHGLAGWYLCDSLAKPTPPRAPDTPTVSIKPDTRWTMPAPEITKLPDGATLTRQAAPRGRFEVDLPPTGGVISYDNPRLTAALLSRPAA